MASFFQINRPFFTRRTLLTISLISIILLCAQSLSIESLLEHLRSLAIEKDMAGMIGFGTGYALAVLLFVPAAPLTLLAGTLFGPGWGIAIVAFATSVVDASSFLFARYLARDAIERLTQRYPRFNALDHAITKGGWRVVALLRLSPTIPYSASNYLYGLTGIPFLSYVLTSAIFTLPGIFVYVYLGYVGAETLGGRSRSPTEWMLLVISVVTTLLALAYLTTLTRRALTKQSSR